MNLLTWARGDDLLFFESAISVLKLEWLGEYNSATLSKVPGYSIFLAAVIALKIPYLAAIAFLNIIAVAFLLKNLRWVFEKTQFLSLTLGVFLLYNPIIASGLRIFRNQFSAICFVIFIGAIFSMFNPHPIKENKLIKWLMGLISFFGFAFLFFAREEQLLYWIILLFSGILLFIFRKHYTYLSRNLFLPIVGIVGVIIMAFSISFFNYKHYGRFITCEKTSKPYTSAIKAFHSVEDPNLDPSLPKATASYEKIQKIADIAPTFEKAAYIMCDPKNDNFKGASTYLDRHSLEFKKIDDKYISTSHFEWFWINCVRKSGQYRNAKETAIYYKELEKSINTALQTGELKKRDMLISAGPYFITKEDIPIILKVYFKNFKKLIDSPRNFIVRYENFTARSVGNNHKFEDLTFWQNTLIANYLHPDEKASIMQARNSIRNKAWNFMVAIFAWLMIPAMYFATPIAFLALIKLIVRKNWHLISLLLIITSYYAVHLFLLSSIDVCVGYEGSKISYFFPSYILLMIAFFISLNILCSSQNGAEEYNQKKINHII